MTERRDPATWPVAVFAHNEERHILDCLRSLHEAGAHAYVLVNGSSDGTARLVADYAAGTADVEPVSIAMGDKANAWNVFVHDVAPRSDAYVFVDGDVRVAPGAVAALARTLSLHPEANAAAAVPRSGRDRDHLTRLATVDRLVLGNLYALSGAFVGRLREAGTRIPVGYIGEDGWVTSMAKWDGDPAHAWSETRVEPCPEAGYVYRSFSPVSLADVRKYWRRRVRYSLRHFQHLLLRDRLQSGGLAAMPASIESLYEPTALDALRPRSAERIFDWLALREMRRACRPRAVG